MLNKSFTYTYDKGGNIVSKSEYAYTTGTLGAATDTVPYVYDVTWKDKLTSYDGTSITYNEIGNPLTYGGDISYVWEGRELIRYQDANSDYFVKMDYNADGLRTLKTICDVDPISYTKDYYIYTWSADGTLLGYSIKIYPSGRIADVRIIYGENGDAIGFTVKDYEGVEPQTYTYYYIKNAQGDVLRVVDETGATMADYTYDAWGNFTFTPDPNAGANAGIIEKYNPVTYRGYYYDTDLEMYYLQSRYYNPRWGRFLNADDTFDPDAGVLSANLYAYCANNPVNFVDFDGHYADAAMATYYSLGGMATSALTLGAANSWNPIGWAMVAGCAIGVGGYIIYDQYKIAKAAKVAKTSEELGKIAGKYGIGKCKEAADAMMKALKKMKLKGAAITINFIGKRGYIWSESTQQVISWNGVHVGILYEDRVYCTVHPLGLPKYEWIEDFYGTGLKTVTEIKF